MAGVRAAACCSDCDGGCADADGYACDAESGCGGCEEDDEPVLLVSDDDEVGASGGEGSGVRSS
eukprot:1998742-Prymnesium_polylepis.1